MKRGFILPAILLVVGMIFLLAVTRHFFSRRWALLQGLFNEKNQKRLIFPWLDRQAFAGDQWPGNLSAT